MSAKRKNKKQYEYIYKRILPTLLFVGFVILGLYLFFPKETENKIMENTKPFIISEDEIKLKVLVQGNIKEMYLEDYLVHVVAGEMYPSYEIEALKAQAVAARTYTYRKYIAGGCGNKGADICDDIRHCQAYKENISVEYLMKFRYAVMSTKGEIITYEGQPINALFHSISGGYTEDNANVFGSDVPYLKGVISEGEESSKKFKQEEIRTVAEVKNAVSANGSEITILERYPSGRVKTVNVFGKTMSGKQLREALGLSSANFEVKIQDGSVIFSTTGYGHGVGMSQAGANYLATLGKGYKDILKHYYTGVEISAISKE